MMARSRGASSSSALVRAKDGGGRERGRRRGHHRPERNSEHSRDSSQVARRVREERRVARSDQVSVNLRKVERSSGFAALSMARSNNNGCGRGSKHTVRRCDVAVMSRGKATFQQHESIGVVNGGNVQQRNNDDSTGNSNGIVTGSNHSQIEGTAD
ncbi:hypothetical protein ALC57_03041 [Trachymyrmex cornetzi]|uniref:Uncharacterized protein n=1 Tax=Trachymyrmex cornetzi TaxID=471704 RepID=A0A151JN42_9HYME|nr:hypothetical protein ALC57_03041 [Trachymyrmex cornetzi]